MTNLPSLTKGCQLFSYSRDDFTNMKDGRAREREEGGEDKDKQLYVNNI